MLTEILGRPLDIPEGKMGVSFVTKDGFKKHTLWAFESLINKIATNLYVRNLPTASRIAILSKNSTRYLALYYAIRRAGHIAVPINYKLPKPTIKKILQHSKSVIVFCDDSNFSNEYGIKAELIRVIDVGQSIDIPEQDPDRVALILYTSGSTGEPKPSIITHKSRTWLIEKMGIGTGKRVAAKPFYHQSGLTDAEMTLSGGGHLIVMSEFNTTRYLEVVDHYKPTSLNLVPPMMAMLLEDPFIETLDLGFIQHVNLSSAPVTKNLLDKIKVYFKNATILLRYGSTELGTGLFTKHPEGIPEPELSVGYPYPDIEYKLIDGVLHVKTPGMMSNADNLVDGFFNTGDIFRVDEQGFYYFVGRADDKVKSGGENIHPLEIESAIEEISGVDQAAVVMLPDDIKGMKPYAFIVGNISEQDIKNQLPEKLPGFKIPRRIWILETMPLNGAKKIDKLSLEKIALMNLKL